MAEPGVDSAAPSGRSLGRKNRSKCNLYGVLYANPFCALKHAIECDKAAIAGELRAERLEIWCSAAYHISTRKAGQSHRCLAF